MTIEYIINKESDERFTLKILKDKDCGAILNYVRGLAIAETETWTSIRNSYITYDFEPFGAYKGKYEYLGTFKVCSKLIDYHIYLIQKRIDDINKLEGCLILQCEGVN